MIRNSTIIPKKRNLDCGCYDYPFSKNRCKKHASIQQAQKRIAEHEEQENDESLQNLIADLDFIFSRYIRLKYCDEKGIVECYTSGVKMRWQEAQCGHFVSRSNLATRWLEDNCRPQSEYQNCHLSGNLKVFREKLEKERHRLPEWIEEQAREICKPTRDELKQLIIVYRNKVKILEKKIKQ